MDVRVKQGRIEKEAADVLILGHYEGESALHPAAVKIDRLLGGWLSELLKSREFKGTANQAALVHTRQKLPSKRVLLIGLGKKKEAKPDTIRQAMATAIKRARQVGAQTCLAPSNGGDHRQAAEETAAQAAVEGAVLGAYQFTAYRSNHDEPSGPSRLTVVTPEDGDLAPVKEGVRRGRIAAEATCFVRDLCNHPANVMTPSRVAEEARKLGRQTGFSVKILERRDMERLGMGALLGVARGSAEPPKFIVLEHRGGRRGAKPIVLVGKTITFDSGGISLKPSENMEQMKADMTGGAEVLATLGAAARLKLPLNVIGILPATENMPGGRATKPGDIVKTLSGKTVEIQNTDAEGRLILADGLAFAMRYKPAAIIDVATLTGACVVALGQFAIGMLGTGERMKTQLTRCGLLTGERVWEMPLWDEYFEQLKSDVADMRNIGGRGGGMITAALFLRQFVGEYPWVHLDIASTDWSDRERAYISKGPTGIGTRLLIQYLVEEANG
jgi:leucyl aminopeptidase